MAMTSAGQPDSLSRRVAAEVRAEMARQRLTQRELARRLATIDMSLSRRLNGHIAFNLDELEAIAEQLKVDTLELLRRAEESRARPTALVARHVVPYRNARGVPAGKRRPVRLCASPAA